MCTAGQLNISGLDNALGVGIRSSQISYETPWSSATSSDGRWHATGLDRGVLLLFEGGDLRHAYGQWSSVLESYTVGLAFSPNSKYLAVLSRWPEGSPVHDLAFYNIPGGELVVKRVFGHKYHSADLEFWDPHCVPDSEVDISPQLEIVWSLDSKQATFPLQVSYHNGRRGPVSYAHYAYNIDNDALRLLEIAPFGKDWTKRRTAFSRDGAWIVSMYPSSHKSGHRVFNTRDGRLRVANHFSLNGIAFCTSADEEPHFFLEHGVLACKLPSSHFRLTSARRSDSDGNVPSPCSGSGADACRGAVEPLPWYFDAPMGELTWYMAEADPEITTVDFWLADEGGDLALVAVGRSDGRVEVFNRKTGARVIASRADEDLAISRVLFAPDGRTIWYVRGDELIVSVDVPHT